MDIQHDSVLDQRESVELDQDLEKFLADVNWRDEAIEDNLFDPCLPDIPVSYTLMWQSVPFAPLGGICGLNGLPGNGKTMTFSMLIAALLKGECNGIQSLLDADNTSVLYIDTEMELVNTQRTVRRIYEMVDWPRQTKQPRFNTICLREVNDAHQRWCKILKAIWQFKPTAVFLDGLIDVVSDFNDNKECQERIYQCMSVATHYNISLWCLLHLNPGSDKAVGHLGSFLERKATDIWVTSKDKESQHINVTHKKQRLKKAPDMNFHVDDDEHHYGHPVMDMLYNEEEPATNGISRELQERVRAAVLSVKWSLEGITYSEFTSGLRAINITSNRKVSDYLTIAQQMGIVYKEGKRYKIKYDNVEQLDSQTSLSQDEERPF